MKKSLFLFVLFLSSFFLFGEERPILIVIGTRPEAIKMIPVYEALKKENLPVLLCSTGQHIELVNEVLSVFKTKADYSFNIMKPGQDLAYVTESTLNKTTALLKELNPSLVIVQGDTTSAMAAALAAFYCKIPVAHIEAGLRTHNIYAPFPEELNRQVIARIASLHFTPTGLASDHLKSEGVPIQNIYETGNTVVDALYLIKKKILEEEIIPSSAISAVVENLKAQRKPYMILTAHRRESLESGMEEAMTAIYTYLNEHPELTVVYPVHPNPLIREILQKTKLASLSNLVILPPLHYHDFVYLLLNCKAVLTDSGGIQEEAVSLQKPTLVLRNETDRPEGMQGGIARLVGTNAHLIYQGIDDVLSLPLNFEDGSFVSPYGDGHASERIAQKIRCFLTINPE